jgi:hypothetical protein
MGLALAGALTVYSTPTFAKPCSWALRLDGRGGPTLRALLVEHNVLALESPVCGRALASLAPSERGWRLNLSLDGDQVTRDVGTIDDAAAWVESWLLPLAEGEPEEATAAITVPPMESEAERLAALAAHLPAPAAAERLSARVSLLGLTSFAQDGSNWNGAEINGQLTWHDALWFGSGIGFLTDPLFGGDSSAGDNVRRQLLRAGVRAGGRLLLKRDLRLDLGLGGGFALAYVKGKDAGRVVQDDESVVFGELVSLLEYRPHPNWVLLTGLSLSLTGPFKRDEGQQDANEQALPPGHPRWLGSLSFGLGYTFVDGP